MKYDQSVLRIQEDIALKTYKISTLAEWIGHIENQKKQLKDIYCDRVRFSAHNLDNHSFRNCFFKNCHFTGANLTETQIQDTVFEECSFLDTAFCASHIYNSRFNNCKFGATDFADTSLTKLWVNSPSFFLSNLYDVKIFRQCLFETGSDILLFNKAPKVIIDKSGYEIQTDEGIWKNF